MDPLPPLFRLTLRPGTVYYFVHRKLTSSEPHYFVVLNANPLTDSVFVMAIGSSQIDKVRKRRVSMPPETLVEVSPAEYKEFSMQTIVDCNQVFELPREELVAKYQAREIGNKCDMPASVFAKIIAGVESSPRIDEGRKKLLRNLPKPSFPAAP